MSKSKILLLTNHLQKMCVITAGKEIGPCNLAPQLRTAEPERSQTTQLPVTQPMHLETNPAKPVLLQDVSKQANRPHCKNNVVIEWKESQIVNAIVNI